MSLSFSCHCIRCTNHRREHSQQNESHTLIGLFPRKECMSVWSSRVGTGSVTWLRPERLRRRLPLYMHACIYTNILKKNWCQFVCQIVKLLSSTFFGALYCLQITIHGDTKQWILFFKVMKKHSEWFIHLHLFTSRKVFFHRSSDILIILWHLLLLCRWKRNWLSQSTF